MLPWIFCEPEPHPCIKNNHSTPPALIWFLCLWLCCSLTFVATTVWVQYFAAQYRQSKPQHVTSPHTSMQSTTAGLAGIRNSEQPTLRPANKIEPKKKSEKTESMWEDVNNSVHSLLSLMSQFVALINTKHTEWLRAVMIDYPANWSRALSICPYCKIQQFMFHMHQV